MLGSYCGEVCQVEVVLTLLKLTETGRRAGRQAVGRAKAIIGILEEKDSSEKRTTLAQTSIFE